LQEIIDIRDPTTAQRCPTLDCEKLMLEHTLNTLGHSLAKRWSCQSWNNCYFT